MAPEYHGSPCPLWCPTRKYYPYTNRRTPGLNGEPTFDDEPSSFVYSLAENFEALNYFYHNPQGMNLPPEDVLFSVKKYLAAGIPSMFGFFGFLPSIIQMSKVESHSQASTRRQYGATQ